jgi:hypothetical protein
MDADSALAAAERAITGRKAADPLGQLAASLELSRAAGERHRRAIITARESGATWLQIAQALGLESKQAGKQAYDRAAAALERSAK